MNLKILETPLSVCKIKDISDVNFKDDFVFLSKTDEELSLVCATPFVPPNCITREDGWRGFRIQGELDFSLIGIISKISSLLAQNNIGIFVISTFNTDYILVKEENLPLTIATLTPSGYLFV